MSGGILIKILVTSIVDLKKSQHNRPHQFVRHLSKKHDVTVVSINDWWKGSQENMDKYSQEFNEIFKNVNYIHITERKISPIIQEIISKGKINKSLKGKDFDVHLNYSTLMSGYYAAKKIKTVYDIADDLSAMIKESPQIPPVLRSVGGAYGDYMLKRNLDISDMVTVTTDGLRKTYNIDGDKSEVIPNGVDVSQFKNNYATAKNELGLDGFIIGYVGVLREWIDFEPIFSALADLDKEIKMVIVGKEGRFWENIELAKKYEVEDRVVFTGMVPYSKVPQYISAMDVCLMPFKKCAISENAVPLKLFEYMSCEKPIISTRLNGIESVVQDKIFYASGKEDYKRLINILFNDKKLANKMGTTGRKFVEEQYDWSKITGQMEKIMVEVAGQ